jgi:benzoate 4-monooxygenase
MVVLKLFTSPSPWAIALTASLVVVWYYLYPYLVTYRHLRRIPGPLAARLSNIWLLRACRFGKRYAVVDRIHSQFGPVVRIQPNHVSINDDEAIYTVYGHGNGFLKPSYYDAFVSIRRGIFTTRDRADHTRRRKIISHTFSPKSISQFEPYVHTNIETFIQRWDGLAEEHEASGGAHFNALHWFNYLAFDIIGDLAFGAPFGMLQSGGDVAEMRPTPDSPPVMVPAIQVLNRRGEVSATLGCRPELKPWAWFLPDPFFSRGLQAVEDLAGIAIARVKSRLESPPHTTATRKDLLQRLSEGRDEKGEPLGREELTAEALTQLIAGSDTVANTLTAIMYYVARHPEVVRKLRAELDVAIPSSSGITVPTFDMVRDLPYLKNVIHESLRIQSTSGIGLPRQVPEDSPGIWIRGYFFPPGTVVSVPGYSIHRSKDIWGPDADEFRPERWDRATTRQKNAFIPFSHGPRACLGRNVAEMELKLILTSWVRRYDVTVAQDELKIHEGFLRKPLRLDIVLKKREISQEVKGELL